MATPAGSPSNKLRIDLARHVGVEIGRTATSRVTLNETAVRNLAGKPTVGTRIALSDLWNKSKTVTLDAPRDLYNYILQPSVVPNYIAGFTDVVFNIPSTINVYSADVNKPALTVKGFTAGDTVTIVNNNYIIGKGGSGGYGGGGDYYSNSFGAQAGFPGGTAIRLEFPTKIINNGIIGGGGGGGGGGGRGYGSDYFGACRQDDGFYAGGGGGGGAGGDVGSGGPATSASGQEKNFPSGAGSNGTKTTGGAGGGGGNSGNAYGGTGGAGGALGAPGGTGGRSVCPGGDSWNSNGAAGGAGGYSIIGYKNLASGSSIPAPSIKGPFLSNLP